MHYWQFPDFRIPHLSGALGLQLGPEVAARFSCTCGTCWRVQRSRAFRLPIALDASVDCWVAYTLQAVGLDAAGNKRPMERLFCCSRAEVRWRGKRPTISLACAHSCVLAASAKAQAAAELAESRKARKYSALADLVDFRAVGLETFRSFGSSDRLSIIMLSE